MSKLADNDIELNIKQFEILNDSINYTNNNTPNNTITNYDLSFKIIIIGNAGVGKSSLSLKATKNKFIESYITTVGIEHSVLTIKMNNNIIINLQIWDTCGQEKYRALVSNFYRNTSLAIIVYSINNEKSFKDIEMWIKDLKIYSSPDIKIFLIGNKVDLENERKIKKEEGNKLYKDYELDLFLETSAKLGINAKEVFLKAAEILYLDYKEYKIGMPILGKNSKYSLGIQKNIKKRNEGCC